MEKVKAVCDSGPLMALAKLGVLSKVFSVYPGAFPIKALHRLKSHAIGLPCGAGYTRFLK